MEEKEVEHKLQRNGYTIHLSSRQMHLIANCQTYTADSPAGFPGHEIILLVAKLSRALDIDGASLR